MSVVEGNNVVCADRVFSVERALMLLQCFEFAEETRTLASLARQSGLYKSTILRLSNSLCKMGFLSRRSDGLFAVGPELTRFGTAKRMSFDIEGLIRPNLQALADTKYNAFFCVRHDRRLTCLYRENGVSDPFPVGMGAKDPLANGAAFQVLRAYSRYAKDEDLMLVRKRRWALTLHGHLDLGVFAVPVLNREKELLGALAVVGHSGNLSEERQRFLRHTMFAAAHKLGGEMRFMHATDLTRARGDNAPDDVLRH